MAPPQRVLVSYSGTQAFLSGTWPQIHAALVAQQLPLRNIHWKSPSRPSIRTIQELDISLIPLESVRDEHTSQIPATLLEKPFLNMYVVTCEVAQPNQSAHQRKSDIHSRILTWRLTKPRSSVRSKTGTLSLHPERTRNGLYSTSSGQMHGPRVEISSS